MEPNLSACPKCGDEMEDGFIADYHYGGVSASRWVEGQPQKSFWFGTDTSNRTIFKIMTQRCLRCGYLELYAPEPPVE